MRPYGALNPIDQIDAAPDTVVTFALASGTPQAADWFTSTGAVADAVAAKAHLVRFTGFSSAGTPLAFVVNVVSTHAVYPPSSGTSASTGTTAGSTGNNLAVSGTRLLQIPQWSTGYSVGMGTSGYVMGEIWRK